MIEQLPRHVWRRRIFEWMLRRKTLFDVCWECGRRFDSQCILLNGDERRQWLSPRRRRWIGATHTNGCIDLIPVFFYEQRQNKYEKRELGKHGREGKIYAFLPRKTYTKIFWTRLCVCIILVRGILQTIASLIVFGIVLLVLLVVELPLLLLPFFIGVSLLISGGIFVPTLFVAVGTDSLSLPMPSILFIMTSLTGWVGFILM